MADDSCQGGELKAANRAANPAIGTCSGLAQGSIAAARQARSIAAAVRPDARRLLARVLRFCAKSWRTPARDRLVMESVHGVERRQGERRHASVEKGETRRSCCRYLRWAAFLNEQHPVNRHVAAKLGRFLAISAREPSVRL